MVTQSANLVTDRLMTSLVLSRAWHGLSRDGTLVTKCFIAEMWRRAVSPDS